MAQNTYSSDNIKVLSDREHIQMRKSMYLGESSTDPRQLLSEIIDNALDECQAGYSTETIVSIDTINHRYTVRDYGRGIPHGKKDLNGEKKEILEVLLTKANSGGKFDNSAYNYSCFAGNTKITLADNTEITFADLYKDFRSGKEYFCFSSDYDGHIYKSKIINVQITKQTRELINITLKSGAYILCTPDHRFMLSDGSFVSANCLADDMDLMSLTDDCIVDVREILLSEAIDVYDLTVDGPYPTFMLSAGGIFVHNCGLHGLGITITNALSKHICITSYRNGQYVKGEAFGTDEVVIKYGKSKDPDGTIVVFEPDKKFFQSLDIPISFVKDRCRVASAFGFRTRLIVDGQEVDTNASIFDLIKEDENKPSTYVEIGPIDVLSDNKERMMVAMRYTSETNDRYFGYTNLLTNYLGGTHVQELSKTIISTWKDFIEKHKNIKPGVDLHNNDYLVGLRSVCAVFISNTEFSSQTKEKLVVNKKYFEELMSLFSNQLYKYLDENIIIAQQLIKRFEEYRIAQNVLLSRKEISSLIKINTDSGDNIRRRSVVSKLVDCTSKKRDNTELFLVEGNSALGPYLYTRNKETQAMLPLRGKILNVTFKTVKEAVQNSEVCDIANSIGAGIGASCDASKSRYDKIIISSDADEDGKHITSLLASLFVNLFPDLVKEGKVWIALPPLFSWGDNPKNFGWCNDINDIPKNVKSFHRFKGLGEMQNDQLKYFCVDPNTRRQVKLEFPSDIDEFNRIVGSSQGKHDLLKDLGIIEEGL